MRFAASRLPTRLASLGSSVAVIQSSAPSTPEHREQGERGHGGAEAGETRRGAGVRAAALAFDVAFDARAAPHSRRSQHGRMRRADPQPKYGRCTPPPPKLSRSRPTRALAHSSVASGRTWDS